MNISIHAPAWGATHHRPPGHLRQMNFNPRSRMGSDHITDLHRCIHSCISIHAPAWGATKINRILEIFVSISIHAPAWGATAAASLIVSLHPIFQSTLPHGERLPFVLCCFPNRYYFNPRSRMGSDFYSSSHVPVTLLFQSTLPHGERQRNRNRRLDHFHFNPRSRMGSDLQVSIRYCAWDISIHAPAWGATCYPML